MCMLPVFAATYDSEKLTLSKQSMGNTGAVISAELSCFESYKLSAASSDSNIADCYVRGHEVIVNAKPGAVGVVSVTVTANTGSGSYTQIMDVPVGYTTFVFSGYSVTVIEGDGTNYELVGLNPADETERSLEQTTDADGNTVYTGNADSIPSVAIKKNGGTYVFEGTATDASINVKKEAKNNAFLLLNGLNLTSSFTSPITVKKDSQAAVIITAITGTVNTLTDAAFNNSDNYGPAEDGGDGSNQFYAESAVIKAKTGATVYLNGGGTLNINANAKNGIKMGVDSMLEISELTLNVNSVYNGISGDNEIDIRGGNINVTTTGNDAVKAENDDTSIGTILITGGNITINSADEGIYAAERVMIYGGTFDITCGGDAIKSENLDESDGDIYVYGGDITIDSVGDGFQSAGETTIYGGVFDITCCDGHTNSSYNKDTDPSAKGIKSGNGSLTFYGGSVTVDSADDSLHSNTDLIIRGGTFLLASGDDGVHADYRMFLGEEDGNDEAIGLTVTDSYEGIEAANIYVLSGNYDVYSDDDCVNAANGDLSGYSFLLRMYGGSLICHGCTGDGVDSNGELSVYGGNLEVYAPGNGNAALDCDGSMNFIGGSTIGVGSSGMVQTPNAGVYVRFGSSGWGGGSSISFSSGDPIAIYNSSNTAVFESTVVFYGNARAATSVVFASDALVAGQTYYLYKNGSQVASASAVNAGSASVPEIPEIGEGSSVWKPVGETSTLYARTTSMTAGIPAIITNTSSTYALTGGSSVSGSAVTVSASGSQYSITGVTAANTWYRDAAGHIYCTIDGTNCYLAYTTSGGSWNPSYTIRITTDYSTAPIWTVAASGTYARISTTAAGQGGPGGQGRTLYLYSNGSGFSLSTGTSNVYIYSPDTAMAALSGKTAHIVNIDNGESITEAEVLAQAEVRYKSGINAEEQTLAWTDSHISLEWNMPLAMEQGNYVLTISVDGTVIGTISVMVLSPFSGGTAPIPAQPEEPDPTPDPTPTPEILIGDVNGDGMVNAADAVLIMRHALSLELLEGDALIAADYNGDGSITTVDALTVLRASLGLN